MSDLIRWKYVGPIGFGRYVVEDSDGATPVAVVYGPTTNPQSDRNVRLIENAPLMLEAIRAARDAFQEYCEYHGAVHDDDCPCDDTCVCSQKPFNDRVNAASRMLDSAFARVEALL
jgi:hypothetical protein